ncbi:3-oxoacid CoA-transferase subunit B [Aquisalibacillus elongatus]|uniref:3-oxoacid CoA-transferase subunit B n=1 Tax=Aquisalibacillus elongatus TaxID=485577 RepID=UPI000F543089|nr:3-oxoacid CoA-transferase subunit B [Aquisalibacillus elongatus]
MDKREIIAKRAAEELKPGSIINLGIGIPTLVTKFINPDDFFIHTENGLLGMKELESDEEFDPLIVNAGKMAVGEEIGASYFDSATSFSMIRGGHVDVAILGALQVDENGQIANWAIPGKNILGVGGAMDLLSGAKKVIVSITHTAKDGRIKLVKECDYPITSLRAVDAIVTDLGFFERVDHEWVLKEIMPNSSLEEITKNTEFHFKVDQDIN